MDRHPPGPAIITSMALLAVAVALSIGIAAHGGGLPGERPIIRGIQDWPSELEGLLEAIYSLTGTRAALIAGVVPSLYAVWRWRLAAVPAIVAAVFAVTVLQPAVKNAVDRPRPSGADIEARTTYTSESFPSGHVMSTTVVWGSVALVVMARAHGRRRWFAAVLLAPIVLTSVAALYLGAHWPSDLAGGLAWGAFSAVVVLVLLPHRDPTAAPS